MNKKLSKVSTPPQTGSIPIMKAEIQHKKWLKEAMERNSYGKLFQSLAALNLKDFKP